MLEVTKPEGGFPMEHTAQAKIRTEGGLLAHAHFKGGSSIKRYDSPPPDPDG